jgi:hypothetical protein
LNFGLEGLDQLKELLDGWRLLSHGLLSSRSDWNGER